MKAGLRTHRLTAIRAVDCFTFPHHAGCSGQRSHLNDLPLRGQRRHSTGFPFHPTRRLRSQVGHLQSSGEHSSLQRGNRKRLGLAPVVTRKCRRSRRSRICSTLATAVCRRCPDRRGRFPALSHALSADLPDAQDRRGTWVSGRHTGAVRPMPKPVICKLDATLAAPPGTHPPSWRSVQLPEQVQPPPQPPSLCGSVSLSDNISDSVSAA